MAHCNNKSIVYPELSYELVGILFEVHNELGCYCNEKQCGDAIVAKLKEHGLYYEREKVLPLSFPNEKPGRNRIDFYVVGRNGEKIIIELKMKRMLTLEDYHQTRRYLAAADVKLALLVNFRSKYLAPKRVLNSSVSE